MYCIYQYANAENANSSQVISTKVTAQEGDYLVKVHYSSALNSILLVKTN